MSNLLHIDPASFNHKFVTTHCGFKYHYVEEGDPKGEPLLLVHGFPDIWYGWRYQIGYLAKLGYRVIAIDCLGYGQSDSPQDLQLYGMKSLCKQIVCILDELQIPKVTLIGHDWGGAIVWRFGYYHPDRLNGIISVCTPCNPPAPEYRSLEDIVKMVPEFEYQLNLAHPDTAAKMDKETHGFLSNILAMGKMLEKDIKYIADQFVHSTFRGPLNYYKTTKINFDDERGLGKEMSVPCWLVFAEQDIFFHPRLIQRMELYMPNLKIKKIQSGHFVLTESPDELNVMLEDCLEDLLVKRRKTVVKSNL